MNNAIFFNAAYSGCVGGSSQRVFTSGVQASYVPYLTAAEAFATAIDTAIPTSETPTQDQANMLMEICHGYWTTRFPQNTDPLSYTTLVQAIVALWNEAIIGLV
jgi:hypothetical protein